MWIVYNLLQSLGIEVFQPQSISGMSHPWLRVSWQKRLLSFQVFLAIDPVIDDVTTWRCGPNELAWAVAMEKCMGARHEVRIRLIKKQSFAFFLSVKPNHVWQRCEVYQRRSADQPTRPAYISRSSYGMAASVHICVIKQSVRNRYVSYPRFLSSSFAICNLIETGKICRILFQCDV